MTVCYLQEAEEWLTGIRRMRNLPMPTDYLLYAVLFALGCGL